MVNIVSDYFYATVAYADIFAYSLTIDDVYFWFIKRVPKRNLRLGQVRGIKRIGNVVYLRGRKGIIARQKSRLKYSQKKWELAKLAAAILRFIPTITLVGVTGGLAMRNADKLDDIDFFIITAPHTVWITRFLTVLLFDILQKRRKPEQTRVADKICLNMFMSEDVLRLPKEEQDLFSAHEILQMEPLWSRGDIYRRFLHANNWVKIFLPIAWRIKQSGNNFHTKQSHWWTGVGITLFRLFELPARIFQLWYMKKKRTIEYITSDTLRFHPKDARVRIKKELNRRLKKMNIPLDNIFYAR